MNNLDNLLTNTLVYDILIKRFCWSSVETLLDFNVVSDMLSDEVLEFPGVRENLSQGCASHYSFIKWLRIKEYFKLANYGDLLSSDAYSGYLKALLTEISKQINRSI